MNPKNENMLRAGQLAKLADVSTATIKHYVNEGLIPKPVKTGKTMAYYDPSCVERIRLIKKLQRERFLPLDVIKRALDSGSAYEEEIELGKAIFKSHKTTPEIKPISEARIERRTGYPLQKIHLLEKEDLVSPLTRDGVKHYDTIDCKIIEIIKHREDLGLPFDHSLEVIRLYRDAIREAVEGDIRLFAQNLLGDYSTMQAIKFLTEADDSLDEFMLLIRQKMLLTQSRDAMSQVDEFSEKLNLLLIPPVSELNLSEDRPDAPPFQIIHMLITGKYEPLIEYVESNPEIRDKSPYVASVIMAHIFTGNTREAYEKAKQSIPKPGPRSIDNAASALAHLFLISTASGFSEPTYLAKRGLGFLKRIENSREKNPLLRLISRYICGATYTMLPDMFGARKTGEQMLTMIEKSLRKKDFPEKDLPVWLSEALDYEIFPALEVRVNRFLAESYLKSGNHVGAKKNLTRIIEITDAEDEHSAWARLKKVEADQEVAS